MKQKNKREKSRGPFHWITASSKTKICTTFFAPRKIKNYTFLSKNK